MIALRDFERIAAVVMLKNWRREVYVRGQSEPNNIFPPKCKNLGRGRKVES